MLPDKDQWCKAYLNDKFYDNLQKYTEYLVEYKKLHLPDINFENTTVQETTLPFIDPREMALFANNKFDLYSLYIVDYIRSNNNGKIYDIGCASNMFKYFFDNVIGIDPYHANADIKSKFNESFAIENYNKFENAIAINSLHYIPITRFRRQLINFANCIMKGGYGYVCININQLVKRESKKPKDIESYIEQEIADCGLDIVNLMMHDLVGGDDGLDGNIRILFKQHLDLAGV